MDYSAISHDDPDHPSGTSPWDSPGADRTNFASANNDVPPSPLPPQTHSPGNHPESPQHHQPAEAADPNSPDLSERLQSAQLGDPDYHGEQPPHGTQQRSELPARYQTSARQHSRPAPAYRIQAKITGLERTGKKDPVLRFDVHVSNSVRRRATANVPRQMSRNSGPHSIEMCDEPIPNSSNWLNT